MRDTKHLAKHANKLAESKKEKELFRTQRKAVEAGAHGTLEYTIKKGVNKNKIADDKILKSKKQFKSYNTFQTPQGVEYVQDYKFPQILML